MGNRPSTAFVQFYEKILERKKGKKKRRLAKKHGKRGSVAACEESWAEFCNEETVQNHKNFTLF